MATTALTDEKPEHQDGVVRLKFSSFPTTQTAPLYEVPSRLTNTEALIQVKPEANLGHELQDMSENLQHL